MKRVVFGLGIFIGGSINIGSLFIALAIRGLSGGLSEDLITNIKYADLTDPFLISLIIIALGLIIAATAAYEEFISTWKFKF